MKALKVATFSLIVIALGDLLARYVNGLPMEIPLLTGSAQWILRWVSPQDTHNPDTVEFVSGIVLFVACVMAVGIVLYGAMKLTKFLLQR